MSSVYLAELAGLPAEIKQEELKEFTFFPPSGSGEISFADHSFPKSQNTN
jgi:hypothetical protein